jgi:hypothetical protein
MWVLHPQGNALSILDFFQSVLLSAGRPKSSQSSQIQPRLTGWQAKQRNIAKK